MAMHLQCDHLLREWLAFSPARDCDTLSLPNSEPQIGGIDESGESESLTLANDLDDGGWYTNYLERHVAAHAAPAPSPAKIDRLPA